MIRIRILLVAAVSAVALGVVVPLAGARLGAKAQTVKVTMTEFKFVLSPKSVRAGTVTFKLMNKGKLVHDFNIAGKTSPKVAAGKTGTLTVKLTKGKHAYKCTVPGHAAAGMRGVLTVS